MSELATILIRPVSTEKALLKIERENKPLVNVPVRFKIEGVDAKYDTLSRTDKNGVAECKVYEIKSEGKGIINANFDTKIMKREIMGDTAITDITCLLYTSPSPRDRG